MIKLLMNTLKRKIRFIAAAKSCRRPLLGHMILGSGAIPVERPQDVEPVSANGKIVEVK